MLFLQLRVLSVAVFIPNAFLADIVHERFGEVYALLIGDCHGDPKQVGKFIGKSVLLAMFPRLVAMIRATSPVSSASIAMLVRGEKYRTPVVVIHWSTSRCIWRMVMSGDVLSIIP